MKIADLEKFNLPDTPGVYVFLDCDLTLDVGSGPKARSPKDTLNIYQNNILYIGKATSLKSRTKSYFDNNILHTRGLHISNMITLSRSVVYFETRSVLEALLLETELIKIFTPKYNTISKDDKSYFVLTITDEDFPRVVLVRLKDIDKDNNLILKSKTLGSVTKEKLRIRKTFGPYASGTAAKDALKIIRKIFPFRDKCLPYDKKHPNRKNPCFSYQIGLCPGICVGVCDKKKYAKIIERLESFLEGNGEKLRNDLELEMGSLSKEQKYEEALKIRDTLFALDHIRDAHLIQREVNGKEIRIEAYDIAHISGSSRVGVMTVFEDGVLAKHKYKKFKISTDENNDLGGLQELVQRRLKHIEWGIPDILVLDGDGRHENLVKNLLENLNDELQVFKNVKIVLVTKGRNHKAARLTGDSDVLNQYKSDIVMLNAEAHRFAINYHKNVRQRKFLG